MSENGLENENTNDQESNSSNDTFDTLLSNMNQDSLLHQINNSIDQESITLNDTKFNIQFNEGYMNKLNRSKEKKLSFDRSIDILFFLFLLLEAAMRFLTTIEFILQVTISFYSVIIINYAFFISSIVSYVMSPIYKSFSSDWLNFFFH